MCTRRHQTARTRESKTKTALRSHNEAVGRFFIALDQAFCLFCLAFASRSAASARCSSDMTRLVLYGFFPSLKGYSAHFGAVHSLTSLELPPQQSMQNARIALTGFFIWICSFILIILSFLHADSKNEICGLSGMYFLAIESFTLSPYPSTSFIAFA